MTPSLLVTDTHPLIWYSIQQSNKLPRKVQEVFDDAVEGRIAIYIPWVVLWELSMAVKAGKVRLKLPLEEYVRQKFFAKAISILEMDTKDVLLSHNLDFGRDSFDNMIVAAALRVKCPLITGDAVIHSRRPCEIFW